MSRSTLVCAILTRPLLPVCPGVGLGSPLHFGPAWRPVDWSLP